MFIFRLSGCTKVQVILLIVNRLRLLSSNNAFSSCRDLIIEYLYHSGPVCLATNTRTEDYKVLTVSLQRCHKC